MRSLGTWSFLMAKAHVPKFGNWENAGNVPYTQYFDNARKGKVTGKIINPNDPQENPESFNEHHPVGAPPMRTSSDYDGPKRRDVDSRLPPGSPLRPDAVARKTDPQRRTNRMNAGSDRSLEQSPLHPNYQARTGGRVGVDSPSREKRDSLEGHGLAPNTPGRSIGRPGVRSDVMPEKGSAVPKFGQWDESDPSSADGFTHIFNKVREEKQVGSARVPNMPTELSYRSSHKADNRGYKSTGCGCFGWLK